MKHRPTKRHDPEAIVREAFERFERVSVSFSGAEDILLVDTVMRVQPDANVFTIDTGRLHPETYEFIEETRKRYGNPIEILYPDAIQVEALVRAKGLFSFFEDGHHECCAIRKVAPLKRKLMEVDAWITGQRRDQSPTRTNIDIVELYEDGPRAIVKFNPFAHWSRERLWTEIEIRGLPYNALHDQGYVSIGCEPCSRPTLPHEHERSGRWWWEDAYDKEDGLHR